MARRRKLLLLMAPIAIVGAICYSFIPTYYGENFFTILLSHPNAPINKLLGTHLQKRFIVPITYVSADEKGNIYILGAKDGQPRLIVINQEGAVEKIIAIRLKDKRIPKFLDYVAVSPSGNRIWVLCGYLPLDKRIIVYGKQGEIIAEWQHSGDYDICFLFASGEDSVYAVAEHENVVFLYTIGQQQFRRFVIPCYSPFFKDGRFWFAGPLKVIMRDLRLKEREYEKDWIGIATWTPEEGGRLFKQFRSIFGLFETIDWVDEKGNFYFRRSASMERGRPRYFLIVSPEGQLLETISVRAAVRPDREEKLEYGQLVKVDKTGIYLEVLKYNEPKEYRIVRIVKKPRWKVWWEKITGKG